jgi:hypothetical protein
VSITYPAEMLPTADEDGADVIVEVDGEQKTVVLVETFDPSKSVWFGPKRDDSMSREELLETLRYERWRENVRKALADHEHVVLMEQVHGLRK